MISVDALSGLLLDLYRASRELAMKDFQPYTLERIRRHIPFDSALWAMSTRIEGSSPHIHDLYADNMPVNCQDLLNLAEENNLIAKTCLSSPGICFNFSPEQLLSDMPQMMVTGRIGMMHVLCTVWSGCVPQLISFLSLDRRDAKNAFTEEDRQLKQYLMPHLDDMLHINRVTQIASIRGNDTDSRTAMAVTDELGMLHAAEPRFRSLLHIEWPDWDTPFLPKPLLNALAENRDLYLGTRILVTFQRAGTSALVTVALRAPGDALSPREQAVANEFTSGGSYKDVARSLGISPLTVRHHLRTIYEKLGVRDKGELSKLLAKGRN